MKKQGYPPGYTTAIVSIASVLGQLIPPSLIMIVYGWVTETSILVCFMSTLLPGLMITATLSIVNLSWAIAQERVAMGNFEMTMSPVASAVDKRLECVILPAGIRDWRTAAEKFVVGSPFIDLIFSWAEEQNLTFLAPYPFYLGGIGFTKEIEKPEDPTMRRGYKIRIPEMTSFRHMVEGLGYIPTPVAWTDVFPALQTGVVDGISGGGAEAY